MLPVQLIPFPLYPFMQEHLKLPTLFVHDPPLARLAQLSMPNAHSSISAVPINDGKIKWGFQKILNSRRRVWFFMFTLDERLSMCSKSSEPFRHYLCQIRREAVSNHIVWEKHCACFKLKTNFLPHNVVPNT